MSSNVFSVSPGRACRGLWRDRELLAALVQREVLGRYRGSVMGGSSNTVLHMLAIAKEAGVNFELKDINAISKRVSHIAKISPSLSTVHMEDINKAGGVNAVMKEMTKRGDDILIDNLTISGETTLEKIKDAYIKDTNIIHTIDKPYSQVGGLAILYGNLAEQGAVIKTAGITGSRVFTGKAVRFDGQPEAIKGIVSIVTGKGWTAPQAAGVIHTDFEKGFIRAAVS